MAADTLLKLLSLAACLWGAKRGIRLAFGDSATAKRELRRHPLIRVADLKQGPAQISGRLVACDPLVTAPLGQEACVAYLTVLSLGSVNSLREISVRQPQTQQRFLVDDGTGRALVVVPPPPPEPLPGDDYDYEVLWSFPHLRRETAGMFKASRAVIRLMDEWAFGTQGIRRVIATEGVLRAGDAVVIGGYVSETVDPTGESALYRATPTRAMLTATRYYPLLILKR